MNPTGEDITPMMRQYREVKRTCGDAILLFRLGDFYEMFEEDARIASEVLDLALTRKFIGGGKTVPLAGIPYHALNNYLFKLTRAGYRVAICEQVEDAKKAKTIVRREVVRTVTPGTLVEAEGIEGSENNFLAAIIEGPADSLGFAVMDVSTGDFKATHLQPKRGEAPGDCTDLLSELSKTRPSEILLPEDMSLEIPYLSMVLCRNGCVVTRRPREIFRPSERDGWNEGEEKPLLSAREAGVARSAAGAILAYLVETHRMESQEMVQLEMYRPATYLGLDPATERNLELVANLRDGGKKGSLFWVLDRTRTAMGARELRQWILRPLMDLELIHARQDAIAAFLCVPTLAQEFNEALREVKDMERLLSRILYRTASPRDLKALQFSLSAIPHLNSLMEKIGFQAQCSQSWFSPLDDLEDLKVLLEMALVEEPPQNIRDGGIFADGYNAELDDLRSINRGGKDWIIDLQNRERGRTGISSLKVGYNKVFGYYIEVTSAHQQKVPPDYIRKQTLVNAERFITPELKEYENKILTAQERIIEIEKDLFSGLLVSVSQYAERIQVLARRLAGLDALQSLARIAAEHGYCRPTVDREDRICITQGRHPTLDCANRLNRFVPNDACLDQEKNQILIITGPNMGGKSTYIRQVALLVLMAQIGSYIPAAGAQIGLVDSIFSRVGASDNLFGGQSTFMVEMSETATILRHATPRSLVVLDEIGRGTATYDGISLAWAIAEYLLAVGRAGVKTLFATHYHELAELEGRNPRVKNYHALAAEQEGKVTFLYQVVPGRSDHSYGIHVAELAGIPRSVIRRADKVLQQLESGDFHRRSAPPDEQAIQLSLFSLYDEPLSQELRALSPEDMTPFEALRALDDLVRKARREGK